ncbi:MAG TPA: four helix bundle protein [Vicinamibacterales bacterium]|nr:four helix bundle protein [Vicinamibacterales bacterium]
MSVRTSEFQCATIDEYRSHTPRDDAERILWHELLRTVTSLANNCAESDGTQTGKDFIQKFQISLKEGRESLQLLRALTYACTARKHELQTLTRACNEIVAILVTSLRTAKANELVRERERKRRK